MSYPNSTRSSQSSLPAVAKPPPTQLTHTNPPPPPVHSSQGSIVIDEMMTSQGAMRREMMRTSESVQAVRQESIMLAEKVQHATNLYRQLATRVGKNEERFDVENKTMANILSQAKQIEMQLMQKQEQLTSRDGQNTLYFHRLQEEVTILKNEREQYRKEIATLQQEVRSVQDKITRQSGALSNGLQDLKSYLDQKDVQRNQELSKLFSNVQGKVDAIDQRTVISKAQTEGLCEKLSVQLNQLDKQRQEDVYQMTTALREKEALSKADVRRVEEKMKNMFEEITKSTRVTEGKLRHEFDNKVLDMERKFSYESKDVSRKLAECDEDTLRRINDVVATNKDENERFKEDIQNMLGGIPTLEDFARSIKEIEKGFKYHKKEIEKVVKAEITSRLSQGDKCNQSIEVLKKDHSEGLVYIEQTMTEHKRKHEEALELLKKEMVRFCNDTIKTYGKTSAEERRQGSMEKKLEELEEKTDELTKQEERITINSEMVKQIEMENILAQGDLNQAIDANTRDITDTKAAVKKMEDLIEKRQHEEEEKRVKSTQAQIELMEKKMAFLANAFESYKSANRKNRKDPENFFNPEQNEATTKNRTALKLISLALEKITVILSLIRETLPSKVDEPGEKKTNRRRLKKISDVLDDLSELCLNEEAYSSSSSDDEDDEEKKNSRKTSGDKSRTNDHPRTLNNSKDRDAKEEKKNSKHDNKDGVGVVITLATTTDSDSDDENDEEKTNEKDIYKSSNGESDNKSDSDTSADSVSTTKSERKKNRKKDDDKKDTSDNDDHNDDGDDKDDDDNDTDDTDSATTIRTDSASTTKSEKRKKRRKKKTDRDPDDHNDDKSDGDSDSGSNDDDDTDDDTDDNGDGADKDSDDDEDDSDDSDDDYDDGSDSKSDDDSKDSDQEKNKTTNLKPPSRQRGKSSGKRRRKKEEDNGEEKKKDTTHEKDSRPKKDGHLHPGNPGKKTGDERQSSSRRGRRKDKEK